MKALQLISLFTGMLFSFQVSAELTPLPVATSEFPPFQYSEADRVTGADTELVSEVLSRMGYQAQIKLVPWKRVLSMADLGQVALIFSFTWSEERDKRYFFTDPLSTARDVFFKKRSRDIEFSTIDDLLPFRIGASGGYSYHESFLKPLNEGLFRSSTLIASDSPDLQGLKLIQFDRIDLFICEVSVCTFHLRRYGKELNSLDYIDQSIGDIRPLHAGFSKLWPQAWELRQRFNARLAEVVKQGLRKELFKKYNIHSPLEPGD